MKKMQVFKKVLVMVCSLAFLGFTGNIYSQIPFTDGFESGNFTTGGWTITGASQISDQSPYEGVYCVKGPGAYNIEKVISTVSGNILTVEYAMKASQTGSNSVSYSIKDENDSAAVFVFFRHTGYIVAYNGNGYSQQVNLIPYSDNIWYNMKIVVNLSAKTYDVFIDGELKADDFNFYNAGFTTPKKFSWGSGETWGTGWVDAVAISSEVFCDSAIALTPSTVTPSELTSLMIADGIPQTLIDGFQGNYAYKITINGGGGYYSDTKMRLCLDGATPVSGIAMGISDAAEVDRTQIGLDASFTSLCSFNGLDWVTIDSCSGGNQLFMRLNSKWGTNIDTYIYYWAGTNQPIDSLGYSLLDSYSDDFGSISISSYSIQLPATCDSLVVLSPSTVSTSELQTMMQNDGVPQSLINEFQGDYAYKITINAGGGYLTNTRMRMCFGGVVPLSGIAKGESDDVETFRTQIGLNPDFSGLCQFNGLGWVDVDTCSAGDPLYIQLDSKWGSNIDTYIYYWLGANQPIDTLRYSLLDNNLDDFGSIMVSPFSITNMLSVTPSNQNVPDSPAGSANFTVISNGSWLAVSDQTWCTVTPSGSGNGTIIASYNVNSTASARTANITVTVPGVTPITVTVTQSAPSGCAPPWQPVTNQQFNMNVIAKLYISNVLTTNAADAIGAFVGTECRGIGYPTPSLNGIIFLTITSNVQSGETVTFKAWKSAMCEECPVGETMPFVNQSEVGTMNSPFVFHCGYELCINFGSGYTWFSVNVNPGSMALNSLFNNLAPVENDRIIGQQSFATYYGNQWVGSLNSIDPKAMYKMKLSTQQNWCKVGAPVAITPITVAGGATSYPWIGYLPQSDLSINSALAGLAPGPASNDRFNGQSSFATYTGTSWVGTLATLQKGKGYIIHLATTSVLTYPTGFDAPEIMNGKPQIATTSPTGDIPNSTPRYNMQLIGSIILPDGSYSNDASDMVYAYVGNECRGLANPLPDVDGRLFLSVGSNFESGENVTFKVYVADENRLYEVKNSIFFSSEMETGTVVTPYVFNLTGMTGIQIIKNDPGIRFVEIYPNPFNATASLEFRLDRPGKIDARIINGLGKVVQTVMNAEMGSGLHIVSLNGELLPPGLYSMVLTYTNDEIRSSIQKKLIIK